MNLKDQLRRVLKNNNMDKKYLKEISNKLTVVIKLLMGMDKNYRSGNAESLLKLLDGVGFSNQEIAEIGGVAVKTIANTKSKMKNVKKLKKGEENGN